MTVMGRALLFALCVTVEGLYVKPSGSSGSLSLSKQASEVKPALSTAEGADVEQHGILWVRNTGKFCMGLLLTLVAATASWYFERQLARLECLLSIGRAACKSVQEAKAYPENTGCLVHLPGQLKPESPVLDPRFACQKLSTSCVRLRTQVQVFQWMESTETTNSQFQQQWSEDPQSLSLSRRDPAKKTPALPMSVGTTITNAASVKFGSGFLLPQGLLDQFCSFRSAAKLLGSEVSAQNGKMRFLLHSDGRFYWRQGEGWSPEQVAADPMSGDLRVAFDMAPSGVATVLALQADQPDSDGSATLLPYRLVPQVYDQGEHKRFLLQEARKSRVGLVQEDQVCPQSRLCCSCNFVAGCCTGMATPEIFRLFEGHKTVDACFADLRKTSSVDVGLGSWSFRLLVLSVLTAGIYIFSEALVYALPAAKVTETPGTLPRFVVSACAALAATNGIISVVFFPFKVGKAFVYLVAACFFGMLPLILMC